MSVKDEGVIHVTIEDLDLEAKRRGVAVYVILDELEKKAVSQLN